MFLGFWNPLPHTLCMCALLLFCVALRFVSFAFRVTLFFPWSCIARYFACIAFKMTRRIKTVTDNDDDFEIQWIFIYPLYSAKVQVHRSIFAFLPDFILSGCRFLSLRLSIDLWPQHFSAFLRRCWYTVYFCDRRNPRLVLRLAHSFAAKRIDIPKILPDELSYSHTIPSFARIAGAVAIWRVQQTQNKTMPIRVLYING